MKKIPVVGCINCTMAFIKEGYFFIQNKSRQLETKIFQTNFLFQKIIFITGEEAAKVFYDPEKFVRKKAVPMRIQKTLLGKRGVQTLDEEAHRNRKEMFMSLMTDKRIEDLISITKTYWDSHLVKWITSDKLILFEEAKEILCKSACKWVGVPLKEDEVKRRANDLWALVDAFGAVGPRHWKGHRARRITERWIEDIVKDARAGRMQLENDCAAARIIFHKGLDGTLLDDHIASVEIINLLRPIVAIANYITFAAHAIYENPQYQQKLAEGNNEYIERFVQEVRRFYPFAPFTGARVRNDFFWRGYLLPKNSLVFLDIYGTNFDSGIWERPEEFCPTISSFGTKALIVLSLREEAIIDLDIVVQVRKLQ